MIGFKFLFPHASLLWRSVCQGEVFPAPGLGESAGAWVVCAGDLKPGHNGLHILDGPAGVLWFLKSYGGAVGCGGMWSVEGDGAEKAEHDPVLVARRVRLLRPVSWNCRAMAAEVAALALPLWDQFAPGDPRPRMAVEAAWSFAQGAVTERVLALASADAERATYGPLGGIGTSGPEPSGEPPLLRLRARWAALAASRCASAEAGLEPRADDPPVAPNAYPRPLGPAPFGLLQRTIIAALDAGVEEEAISAALAPYMG